MRGIPLTLAIVSALALAGCVTGAPEEVDAASAQNALAAATPNAASVPFAFDGSFAPGGTVCPVVTCEGVGPGNERIAELELKGTLTAVDLVLTWDAATPAMEELRLGVSWGPSDDREYEFVDGASPLALAVSDLAVTADDEPLVWVWVPEKVPFLYVHTPQDFHVEGTITETA